MPSPNVCVSPADMGVLPRNMGQIWDTPSCILVWLVLTGTECLQARPRNHAGIWLTPVICHGENSILDGSNPMIPDGQGSVQIAQKSQAKGHQEIGQN